MYINLANSSSLVTMAQMSNQTKHIKVPKAECETTTCTQCHTSALVYKVPDSAPHLYCTKCQNVYQETREENYQKHFRFAAFRKKIMHHIEGNAPICPCGGLFIFNALPSNPKCLHEIGLPIQMTGKERLEYADMLVFDGTHVFTDSGKTQIYSFS